MIAEEQQDRAALYVLGSLDANEIAAFESAIRDDAELRALVRELRETASAIALGAQEYSVPAALKDRILQEIAAESGADKQHSLGDRKVTPHPISWLPWAIAALFLVSLGALLYNNMQLRRQITEMRAADPLIRTSFVALAPAKGAPSDAKATVAWQPDKQSGVIRISGLPAAGRGKDYQLWAVDAERTDPINAGVVHVNPNGTAQVRFKPTESAHNIKAFALSLEREGGVPKREGPILLIGNA